MMCYYLNVHFQGQMLMQATKSHTHARQQVTFVPPCQFLRLHSQVKEE